MIIANEEHRFIAGDALAALGRKLGFPKMPGKRSAKAPLAVG